MGNNNTSQPKEIQESIAIYQGLLLDMVIQACFLDDDNCLHQVNCSSDERAVDALVDAGIIAKTESGKFLVKQEYLDD